MSVAPTARYDVERRYIDGTLVLETVMRTRSGQVVVTDLLALDGNGRADGEGHLIRLVEGQRGSVKLRAQVVPRFDYAEVRPWIRRSGALSHEAIGGNDALAVWSNAGLEPAGGHALQAELTVRSGDIAAFSLRYVPPHRLEADNSQPDLQRLQRLHTQTLAWWRRWSGRGRATGGEAVQRSALVLCGLSNADTGAIAAAASTSLPAVMGGVRNWDYRYSWIRDSTLAVRALAELGYEAEADAFRRFIQRSAAGHVDDLQIAYGMAGAPADRVRTRPAGIP